jgi:hypothetical protein
MSSSVKFLLVYHVLYITESKLSLYFRIARGIRNADLVLTLLGFPSRPGTRAVPRKYPREKREAQMNVRLTEHEHFLLSQCAEKKQKYLGEWAREALLALARKELDEEPPKES